MIGLTCRIALLALLVLGSAPAGAETIPLPTVTKGEDNGEAAGIKPQGSRLCGDIDRLTPSDDSRLLPDNGPCAPSVVTVPSVAPRRSLTGGGSRLGGGGSRLQ